LALGVAFAECRHRLGRGHEQHHVARLDGGHWPRTVPSRGPARAGDHRLIEALRPFIPRTATAPPFDGVAISSLTDELCARVATHVELKCAREELQTRKAEDFPES
jgi:hypothetical protein